MFLVQGREQDYLDLKSKGKNGAAHSVVRVETPLGSGELHGELFVGHCVNVD